jgi:hypothetical protein
MRGNGYGATQRTLSWRNALEATRVNAPGFGGYLLAYAASVLAYGVLMGLQVLALGTDVLLSVVYAILVIGVGAVVGLPFALVLIPAVHLACRTVRNQAVHVAAAGFAGLSAGAAVWGFTVVGMNSNGSFTASWEFVPSRWSSGATLGAILALGIATAIGRSAVIPLVLRRRNRATVEMVWPTSGPSARR